MSPGPSPSSARVRPDPGGPPPARGRGDRGQPGRPRAEPAGFGHQVAASPRVRSPRGPPPAGRSGPRAPRPPPSTALCQVTTSGVRITRGRREGEPPGLVAVGVEHVGSAGIGPGGHGVDVEAEPAKPWASVVTAGQNTRTSMPPRDHPRGDAGDMPADPAGAGAQHLGDLHGPGLHGGGATAAPAGPAGGVNRSIATTINPQPAARANTTGIRHQPASSGYRQPGRRRRPRAVRRRRASVGSGQDRRAARARRTRTQPTTAPTPPHGHAGRHGRHPPVQ